MDGQNETQSETAAAHATEPENETTAAETQGEAAETTPPDSGQKANAPETTEQASPATDDDYANGAKPDESILGKDARITIDAELVRALAPHLRDLGISPQQAGTLANHLAKAQAQAIADGAAKEQRERNENMERMRSEAKRTFNEADFALVEAGMARCLKKGGPLDTLARTTEIGLDPEFMAIMRELGRGSSGLPMPGASSPTTGSATEANSIDGISKLW